MEGIGNVLLRTSRVLYKKVEIGLGQNKLNYRTLFSFKSTKHIFGKKKIPRHLESLKIDQLEGKVHSLVNTVMARSPAIKKRKMR